MTGILQSGNVTPGHHAQWVTDNVLKDGGPNPYSQRVLASLLSADFNSSSDQAIALPAGLNAFQLTGVLITNASTALTAAIGGFYPQAAKTGMSLVANAQVYSFLTDSQLLLNATLTSYAQQQRFSRSQIPTWQIFFALTTGQGGAATADIYVMGIELS